MVFESEFEPVDAESDQRQGLSELFFIYRILSRRTEIKTFISTLLKYLLSHPSDMTLTLSTVLQVGWDKNSTDSISYENIGCHFDFPSYLK